MAANDFFVDDRGTGIEASAKVEAGVNKPEDKEEAGD